ncbi:MAG: hypothetical protein PHV62_03170 [Sulfuricurvum sp.]|nr:hypothetical protein [Sulfuricurvum sp.]
MGIIAINLNSTGLIGQQVQPRRCTLITTDSLATITTAGYLNNQNLLGNAILPTDVFEILYSFNEQTQVGTFGIFQVTYSSSTGFTLNIWENPGNVLLPVVDGDFAVFNGTAGQIKDAGYLPSDATKTRVVMMGAATTAGYLAHFTDITGTISNAAGAVIHPGTIQSGLAGTVGGFIAYPPTTGNGFLELLAINAGGAFNTIISNSAMGQSSTISIPDPGAATAKFILSSLTGAGIQHITSGSLNVDAGNLIAGLAAGGTAGSLVLYPATASNGSLQLVPVGNAGNFNAIISNVSTLGQASTYTMPDPANAAARFLVGATATPFVSGEFPVASGTSGLMVSSGLAASNVQNKTNIKAATTADIGGAGAGPISVVVAGLTAASVVVASIEASSNAVAVAKCNATATGFDITFTGDPGAACTVIYVAFIAAQ